MKIILANGVELSPIVVMGGSRMVQDAVRDTLSFVFSGGENMAALDAAFSHEACKSITIIEGTGSEFIHKGYTVRVELSKKSEEVAKATSDAPAAYEDRITVAMARATYVETQLAETTAALNALLTGEG